MPDRLPSLIVLAGFWVPPAVVGWAAAGAIAKTVKRESLRKTYAMLTAFVFGYAAAWFLFNAGRMPPYIPGATMDPASSPPEAVAALAAFTSVLILPGSAVACFLAFRRRGKFEASAAIA